MRIINKLDKTTFFPFAGVAGTKGLSLRPGAESPRLPAFRITDPRLRAAISNRSVSVRLDPGDDKLLLGMKKANPKIRFPISLKPWAAPRPSKPVSVVSSPAMTAPVPVPQQEPEVKVLSKPAKKKRKPEEPAKGQIRASSLAKSLNIPFYVLAAALGEKYNARFSPLTYVTQEQADAMRDKFETKTEIPEISDSPVRSKAEVRTISDLSASSDGLLSLSDLVRQNQGDP